MTRLATAPLCREKPNAPTREFDEGPIHAFNARCLWPDRCQGVGCFWLRRLEQLRAAKSPTRELF